MRTKSIDQLLRVITCANERFRQGDGIEDAYCYAVNRVAQQDSVHYQTIGDLCRRRLELDNVVEFKRMLQDALKGTSHELQNLIKHHAPTTYRSTIDSFFSTLGNGRAVESGLRPSQAVDSEDVPFTVRLRKADIDVLKAVAHLDGKSPEDVLCLVARQGIKDRLKRFADGL